MRQLREEQQAKKARSKRAMSSAAVAMARLVPAIVAALLSSGCGQCEYADVETVIEDHYQGQVEAEILDGEWPPCGEKSAATGYGLSPLLDYSGRQQIMDEYQQACSVVGKCGHWEWDF